MALRSGGPDNVTVVVADVIDLDYGQSSPILGGAASTEDEEDAPPPNTAAGRAAAMRPPRATPKRVTTPPPVEEKNSHKLRWSLAALAVIALLVGGAFVANTAIQNNYYVGADESRVAIMRGVPASILSYSLQSVHTIGCLDEDDVLTLTAPEQASTGCDVFEIEDLVPSAREQVRAGLPSGALDDARGQMQRLASGDLLPLCEPTPETTPSPEPAAPPAAPAPAPGEAPPAAVEPVPTTTPAPSVPQIPGQNCRAGS